jgi:hypothetical protein
MFGDMTPSTVALRWGGLILIVQIPWQNSTNSSIPWTHTGCSPLFNPNPLDMSPDIIGQPIGTNYSPRNVPIYNVMGMLFLRLY